MACLRLVWRMGVGREKESEKNSVGNPSIFRFLSNGPWLLLAWLKYFFAFLY
jgi:hypothetical protein